MSKLLKKGNEAAEEELATSKIQQFINTSPNDLYLYVLSTLEGGEKHSEITRKWRALIAKWLTLGGNPNKYFLLHDAVEARDKNMIRLLLAFKQTKVDFANKWEETPLDLALLEELSEHFNSNIEIIEMLLANDANVNAIDKNKNTPLHKLCYKIARYNTESGVLCSLYLGELLQAYINLAKRLIAAEASVDCPNKDGETPLDIAKWVGSFYDALKPYSKTVVK